MFLAKNYVFLQAAGGPGPNAGWIQVVFFGLVFIVMYFFIIRPQSKRAKEQKDFADKISSGEQVVTTSGIHGRINKVNEDSTIQLEVSRGVFVVMDRSAISMEMTLAHRKKVDGGAVATTAK